MCVSSAPAAPAPPSPPPPVQPVTIDDPTRVATGREKKKAQAAASGVGGVKTGTILTGGFGLTDSAQSSAKKSLLGQ